MIFFRRKVNRNVIGVRGTRLFALMKREAGGNPARTRRCNEGALFPQVDVLCESLVKSREDEMKC